MNIEWILHLLAQKVKIIQIFVSLINNIELIIDEYQNIDSPDQSQGGSNHLIINGRIVSADTLYTGNESVNINYSIGILFHNYIKTTCFVSS